MRLRLLGVTVAAAVVLAGCSDGDAAGTQPAAVDTTATIATTARPAATTTVAPTTTTSVTEPAFDAIERAMGAIDAWNSGDFDAWLAYWEPSDNDDFLFDRSVMNSNERMEVTAPCEITSTSAPAVVSCGIHVEDDFHGPGGVTSDGTIEFRFNKDGLLTDTGTTTYNVDGECCPVWADYNEAFHRWLRDAHPDVYAEIGPTPGNPIWYLPGFAGGDAAHMLVALDYVDEFVAQSDVYPLGG